MDRVEYIIDTTTTLEGTVLLVEWLVQQVYRCFIFIVFIVFGCGYPHSLSILEKITSRDCKTLIHEYLA